MSLGRLVAVVVIAGLGYFAYRSYAGRPASAPAGSSAVADPVARARAAARAGEARARADEAAAREADSAAPAGSVSENMTPDQVRALLGPPDETASDTAESGIAQERWTYRAAGKTVVFTNGVVTRIE